VNTVLWRWRGAFSAYAHPRVRAMLFLGYSSGLPFALVLMTLAARLKQAGIDRSTIGFFAWVGFAYSLKFFWSPVVDRLRLPLFAGLGRRRSWMLLSQCGVIGGLLLMAFADPAVDPVHMALLAVGTALFAATQDIAVDAYRIEAVAADMQAAMAGAYQTGYQVALICSQAGMFWFVSREGWTDGYLLMAGLMLVGIATTLLIAEPTASIDRATLAREQRVVDFLEGSRHWPAWLQQPVAWLIGAVICPFMDFFARNGWRAAMPILLLIITYRLNYMTMGVMANPFYLDMGFTLDQIAEVAKLYGVIMTLVGALMAGVLVARFGIPRMLLTGLLLLTAANLAYAYIADIGPGLAAFAAVISLDNFSNGLAGAVFIAYMSSLTNAAYTATQYALFGTLWSFPAKGLAGFSGKIVDALGYRGFFIYTALIGLPALLLVLWMLRRTPAQSGDAPR
jgi:PAT family beta-lactamase induction signal transducer AmpG